MLRLVKYQLNTFLLVIVFSCAQKPTAQVTPAPDSYGLWAVDISPDDKYIALGGDDSLLKVFTADLKLHKWVKLHEQGMIKHLSWHPSEKLLGISTRREVWIMDIETGENIPLEGKPDGSRAIGWNFNGELFAAAAGRGMIWIWNKKGRLLRQIQKKSKDGDKDIKDFIAIDWHPAKNIFVTIGDEIRVYDTSGQQINMFKHRERQTLLLTVKWHPSGEFFVTGDYGHRDEGIKTLLQFWKPDGTLLKEWTESLKEFRNIRWTKDGNYLATGSDALRIWTKDGKIQYTGKADGNVLWGVDWTSDGSKIITVSYNGSVKLWNSKAELLSSLITE